MFRFLIGVASGASVSSFRERHAGALCATPSSSDDKSGAPPSVSLGGGFIRGQVLGNSATQVAHAHAHAQGKYDYDLVVIGGGSGGLAAAKRASELGARVCVLDYVEPSATRGTVWGLGGTCVNVGCIPKKLMHAAALVGFQNKFSAEAFGWRGCGQTSVFPPSQCDWTVLRNNVTDHVRSLNFGNMISLRGKNVTYRNAKGHFPPFVKGLDGADLPNDGHTVTCTDAKGVSSDISAAKVLIAVGGRPSLPLDSIEGARDCCITSDDLFSLRTDPGRTLVVGGGYVALECAGFLNGIGRDVTVMVRSIPLRGFDRGMVDKVVQFMEGLGVGFLHGETPTRFFKCPKGKITVEGGWGSYDGFDTVLLAMGRRPCTASLGLGHVGVAVGIDGKVRVDPITHQTTNSAIFAIGDAAVGTHELTPIAIRNGRQFADEAFPKQVLTSGSFVRTVGGRRIVPTTVFTPLEYGCVGMTEEEAISTLGADAIDVFHSDIIPLEWALPHLSTNACYMKMIVDKRTDLVLGFHMVSPSAGEITQGVAVAMTAGATKSHFDTTLGIHPTMAEEMTRLTITRASGISPAKEGC